MLSSCRSIQRWSIHRLIPTQRKGLSTVVPSERLVLSRRAWEAHVQKLPPKPKVIKPKVEEKPWPKNVQIGGGVVASILIPYTAIWVITSTPSLRDMFGPYLPLDRLRTHFGEFEWDVQSYGDKGSDVPEGYYRFPSEAPYLERTQQKIVEEAEGEDLTANIYILGDDSQSSMKETRTVPASTRANRNNLSTLAGSNGTSTNVAVDFVLDPIQDQEEDLMEDIPPVLLDGLEERSNSSESLLKKTHTYSTWYYVPTVDEKETKARMMSDRDIERLRLEYNVTKLESDLKDPFCTRDHDEMRVELKKAKSDLSKHKWKQRFGL